MEDARFLNNVEKNQFEYHLKDGFAFGKYIIKDNVLILRHVFVPENMRGQGIAGKMMEEIMEFISSRNKSNGLKIQPFCAYARSWLENNSQFNDITDF